MGKHTKYGKSDFGSEIHDHHPSCMTGMLNVLDYWGIKNRRRKRSICFRKPKTNSMQSGIFEIEPLLDSESRPVQVGQQTAPERSEGETKMRNSVKRSLAHKQVKEYVDILDILDVNEDVFVKILKDPHRGFTKSVSFPIRGSSRVRPLRSTSLEHKLTENWSFPKKQNLVLAADFEFSKSQEDYFGAKEESLDMKTRISPHGLNHIMANGFRDIKKWIKNALEDRKHKKKHIDGSDLNLTQMELHKMKKTSSLNESLDRYSQLFQRSIRRDVKFDSKSLKLTNEEHNGAVKGRYPRFFRRVSSLSGLESLSSFMTELSRESFDLERRSSVNEEEDEEVIAVDKAEFLEKVEEEMDDGAGEEILDEEISFKDLEKEDPKQSLVSVSESCSSNQIAKKAETLISKAADINPGEFYIFAPDSCLGLQNKSKNGDLEELPTWKKQENCEKYGVFFDFVKNVLEESGFLGDKDLGETWHSEDQPLNPKSHDELIGDDQILFDSINETLTKLYERSSNYFPRTLVSAGRISSMQKGKHLLDEVWGRIRWNFIGLSDNPDRSLDDLVAHDLAKGDDGWMNIETEAEFVTLELEDMIFQELLSELVVCL